MIDVDELTRLRAKYVDTCDRFSAGRVTFATLSYEQTAFADAATKALPELIGLAAEAKRLRKELTDAQRQLELWERGCAMNGVCAQAERIRELKETNNG